MCDLKKMLQNKGLCSGKCDHHKPKKVVMAAFDTMVLVARKQSVHAQPVKSSYCRDKKNCTTNCPEFGNPVRCTL